jgi:glutathione synthase/RimK-type ligase-like ATP-grasp enzyme/ribosomal protein S18 acetylase RimI-like enzyme
MSNIRVATVDDLENLIKLEIESFDEDRRSSRRSIRQSILSNNQIVFIIEENSFVGSMILQIYKNTSRILSIAICRNRKKQGFGEKLLIHGENYSRSLGISKMSLEVDIKKSELVSWYKKANYKIMKKLDDYYGDGKTAFRMTKIINVIRKDPNRLKNIVISDKPLLFLKNIELVENIKPEMYLNEKRFHDCNTYRVFNLCNQYEYQSSGYYMSLLAAARDHRVIPTVATIQDILNSNFMKCLSDEVSLLLNKELNKLKVDVLDYRIFLCHEMTGKETKLSRKLGMLFEAPLLNFTFIRVNQWTIHSVEICGTNELQDYSQDILRNIAESYFSHKKFNHPKLKNYEFNLAILINPYEVNPPSNKKALEKFRDAGEKNGFFVEFITNEDIHRINEFDALFIRETTAVNNYTYEIARLAYAEGLIVIDDPWSIIKCSSKFYLKEKMSKARVLMPKSKIISRGDNLSLSVEGDFKFPLILKQPDSAFSLGVYMVNDMKEFVMKCNELFINSEFIISQEFKPSEFDWRIGILDNQVIFASKYYMVKGHWQIYDWQSDLIDPSGDFETLNIEDVPDLVIETALKATSYIGDGLYGVDLKMIDGKCYLIEINDNPNIDHGIEDLIAGDGLYNKIMESIKNRIIHARNVNKYINL